MQSWSSSTFNLSSGDTSFSGNVTDPAYNGGTSATVTFANPKAGVNISAPAAPDFSSASNSYFGWESSGFGVGNMGLGRFDRGESFTMQVDHAFSLDQINWREFTNDEVLHISWTSGGATQQTLYTVASPAVFSGAIVADANTPVTITNVSASGTSLNGRLRFEKITISLVAPPSSGGTYLGAHQVLMNWTQTPWSMVSGATNITGQLTAPENGSFPVTFTFANPKTGVNITDPENPNPSGAANSYFGLESTGWGVGNAGLGRFDRGESFTMTATNSFQLQHISFKEYSGDELLHFQWTSGGVQMEEVLSVNGSLYEVPDVFVDANTTLTVTNVSPSTANASGRLRFHYFITALTFGTEPTYDASGPDGFVQMFGVNLAGGEFGSVPGTYGTNYIYPNAAEFDYYQSKGLKLIRLPFKWERVQSSLNGALNSAEMTRIDNVIAMAAARDMKIILDMHNYARRGGNVIGSTNLPNSTFKDVWKKIADRYKNNSAIYGYGIMNEPHGTSGLWPAAAQAATDGIREVDTNNWVIVAGDSWSSASSWPTSNPNLDVNDPTGKLMYEAHCYFDSNSDGVYGSYDSEGSTPTSPIVRVAPFIKWLNERGARGFVGEYGVPGDDARWNVLLDNFLRQLSRNGLSGTYWAGGPWWGSYQLSCEPTSNFTVDKPQMSVLEEYN